MTAANLREPVRVPRRAVSSTAETWVRALALTARIADHPRRIFSTVLEERAAEMGTAPALISECDQMTYRTLAERANRYTRWALQQGLGTGDVVCLIMENRPEYVAIWLGISRTGCTVALVNTNLYGQSLTHSVRIVEPKHLIADVELVPRLRDALQNLENAPEIWAYGAGCDGSRRIDLEVARLSGEALQERERRLVTIEDRALCIYTSGTTGLPKAANISHARLMQWSHWFAAMLDTDSTDRLYCCLPMYHSAGGVLGISTMLASGGSVVIRKNFSASQFWNDMVRSNCTLFQYIGELCRYLLHSVEHPLETQHRLRVCYGNGLRRDIWNAFQSRFGIPRILEFYGSTDGNVSLFNVEGKPGAVGRIPPYLAHRFPTALIRYDGKASQPVRNAGGFCERCARGEIGLTVGRIFPSPSSIGNRFEGYTSAENPAGNVLRDVFERGDAWLNTGDLMRQDEQGYFYFVDRVGDTFRWKGENVSTAQVEEAICAFPGVIQAAVYGVRIPGHDGRAGMATLVSDKDLDLAALRAHLFGTLPPFAHPLFLRVTKQMEVTSTFKIPKHELMTQGYDPSGTSDPIYFHHRELGAFRLLTPDLYQRVGTGAIGL